MLNQGGRARPEEENEIKLEREGKTRGGEGVERWKDQTRGGTKRIKGK